MWEFVIYIQESAFLYWILLYKLGRNVKTFSLIYVGLHIKFIVTVKYSLVSTLSVSFLGQAL